MHYRHHMVESCIVTKLIVANISLVSEFSAVVQPTWELKTFCDPLCVAGGPALGCNPVVKNHLYCIMLLVQCWVCVYRAGGDKWWTVFMFVLPPYLLPLKYFPRTTSCSSTLDLSPFIPWSVVCVLGSVVLPWLWGSGQPGSQPEALGVCWCSLSGWSG